MGQRHCLRKKWAKKNKKHFFRGEPRKHTPTNTTREPPNHRNWSTMYKKLRSVSQFRVSLGYFGNSRKFVYIFSLKIASSAKFLKYFKLQLSDECFTGKTGSIIFWPLLFCAVSIRLTSGRKMSKKSIFYHNFLDNGELFQTSASKKHEIFSLRGLPHRPGH